MNMKRTFKQGAKRAFAAVLTVCMLLSILPAGIIETPTGLKAEAASGDVITYSFVNAAMKDTANKNPLVDPTTKKVHTGADEFSDVVSGQPWKIVGVNDTSVYNTFMQAGTGLFYNLIRGKTPVANIVLDFGKPGYYAASATAHMDKTTDCAKLTLTACDENGNVLNGAQTISLGTVDAYSTTGAKELYLSKVYLDSDYYLLKYSATRVDKGSFYLQSLKLTELALDVDIDNPAPVAINSSNLTDVTVSNPTALGTALNYTVSASSDLAAFAVENGKLKITAGDTAGREVVAITFSAGGKSETVNVPIIVYDPKDLSAKTYDYNYLKGNVTTKLNVENTTYAKVSVGATGELNPHRTSEPWKFISATSDLVINNHHAYGAYHTNVTGAVGKVKFQLPSSGNYEIYAKNYTHSSYTSTMSFSIQRADGTGAYGADTALGSISTASTTAAYQLIEYKLGNEALALEAGEYILTYTANCPNSYCFPAGFKLVGVGSTVLNVSAQAPSAPIEIGETVTVPLDLSTVDGAALDYSALAIDNVASSDGNIADVELEKGVDSASLKITGANFGSTALSVKLAAGKNVGTASFRVAVRHNETSAPAAKSMYYDVKKGYSGDTSNDYPKTITYDKLTTGSATELNKNIASDPWAYFSRTPLEQSGNTVSKYYGTSYGINCLTYTTSHLPVTTQLKIQVPAEGYYLPYLNIHPAYNGAIGTTSLYKYNAVENAKGDEIIAPMDFPSGAGADEIVSVSDVPIKLDAGEYIVVFGASKNSPTKVGSIIDGYGLTYVGNKPVIFKAEAASGATIVQNNTVDIPVTLTYTEDNIPVDYDYTNATVEFTYSAEGIAEAVANKTADGISIRIAGKELGTTSVNAVVTAGAWKSSFSILVTVDDGKVKDLYYDMYKVFTNTDASKATTYIDTITYEHTTSGSAAEINKGVYESAPWAFHSKTHNANGYIRFNVYNYGLYFYRDGTINLKLRVGAAGYYKADVLFDSRTSYNTINASLLKYDAAKNEIGEVLASTGVVNNQAETNGAIKIWAPLGDKALWLDEGEYILRVNQPTAGDTRGALEAARLQAVKLMPEVPASVAIGETVEIPAFRGVKLACDTLAATAAKSGIVSVEVDKANGVIKLTGIAAGETTLTATAEGDLGGRYTVPVKVIDSAAPKAESVYYDFVKANTYTDAYVRARDLDSYNYTAAGATDEIGADIGNKFGVRSGAWRYQSWYDNTQPNAKFGWNSAGTGLYAFRRLNTMIRIIVPETGTYQISPVYTALSNGESVKFTLYELNALGTLGKAHTLGTINTAGSGETGVVTPLPGVVSLKAGEYVIDMALSSDSRAYSIDGILFKAPDISSNVEAVAVKRNATITHPVEISSNSAVTSANVRLADDIADIETVLENGELKLRITGKVNGETIVTYEAYMADGGFGVGSFELFVNPAGVIVARDLRFDYHKLNLYLHNGNVEDKHVGTSLSVVTDMSMTIAGSPNEINPNSTVETEPWCYVSNTGSQLRYASYDYGLIFDYEPATAIFKIRVANDGLYRPMVEHMAFDSGAKVKVWLAPVGAASPTADEYYLGEIDTYSQASQKKIHTGLKIVDLDAGDYVLTYKMDGKNPAVRSNGRFGFGAFILKGMNARTIINASVSGPDMIAVGNESEFVLSAEESDGLTGHPASFDVSVSMSNEIATATVVQNSDKTQTMIKLNGTKTGNTVVSVLVATSGVEKTITFPLSVYDGNAIVGSGTEYKYSFSGTMTAAMNLVEVDSFSKMMAGSPDEIRPNNGKTQPWKFEFQQATAFYVPAGAENSYGVCMGTGVGAAAGIRIRLPASGIFTPIVPYKPGNQCPVFRTYIAPVDALDPMDEKYSVGTWDAFSPNGGSITNAVFRSLYLEAGDYIVSWKILKENENILADVKGKSRMWYSGITLKAVDEYPTITVTPEAELPAIKLGNSASVKLAATVADGALEDFIGAEFKVDEASVAKAAAKTVINPDGTASLDVTGLEIGTHNVGIALVLNGAERAKFSVPVTVTEPGVLDSIQPCLAENKDNTIIRRATSESLGNVAIDMVDTDGDAISMLSAELQNAVFTYTSENPSIAKVDENGVITPISDGTVKITCSVTIDGVTKFGEMMLIVVPGKARRSYYTEEKIAAALENVTKYSWARSTRDTAEKAAERYLGNEEFLWNIVTTNELPRSYYVGYRNDPMAGYCRYPECGTNLGVKYGSLYSWNVDVINSPWKVQCPECRRKFPSNDFGAFYQLGIQENGKWSYELAKANNDMLIQEGHGGYLINKDYPEMGEGWGVDDGYGYDTGNITSTGVKEVHTWISYYNHWGIWHANGIVYTALDALKNAYLYTGDAKYGRVGAILLDRVADVYPEQDTRPYRWQLTADASYAPHGKSVDLIWENQNARDYSKAYDAFFTMYTDEKVISFLANKAKQYNMENTKTTANLIRENIEDGILREVYESACDGSINGNFGMTQSAVAAAAVVLDTMPETREWLDWVFQDGTQTILYTESKQADLVTGGNVMRQIIDLVDRDGIADEIAPNYANIWIGGMTTLLEAVEGYDRYPSSNLYNNARFVKMLSGMHPLTLSRNATVQIGDSGSVAGPDRMVSPSRAQPAWKNTGKIEFAQMLYFLNGNSTKDMHYDIFTRNPESLASEVQNVINTYGEYDFDKSEMLTGYGFAALRDGTKKESISGTVDTQNTYWMSFARYAGHGHYDKLNLGIEAYGANIAPELGYPHKVVGDVYTNWGKATVSHNAVVVNDSHQNGIRTVGKPLHFDDSGMVKVMDADASNDYGSAEKYRRSVVTVNIDEETNYAIDFFRVKGGTEQVYSFHALSNETPKVGVNGGDEITLVPQIDEETDKYIGTYEAKNIDYETEGVRSGYSYLRNVDRAANPGDEVYVDFKINNHRNQIDSKREVYLKLTMLNSFDLKELAIAEGKPAEASGNPEFLKFMLARRSSSTGTELDSLFTTVIEPYDKQSKIASMEQVAVANADGSAVDPAAVKAVKVTLNSGRVDYIVYAEDNSAEYLVDYKVIQVDEDTEETTYKFAFSGFIGVYSEVDGVNVYNYMNDGTKIGSLTGDDKLTGTVTGFTKELTDENSITVKFDDADVNVESLAGNYIYVDDYVNGNGAYEIVGATANEEDGTVELDIGDVTLINTLKSAENGVYTYNYNIKDDGTATFSIPLATTIDNSPIITPVADSKVAAGKKATKQLYAVSPIDKEVSFEAITLPRGAIFNTETNQLVWTPDDKQIGSHVVSIRATDGALSSTIYFTINVVKASGSTSDNNSSSTGGAGSGSAGGSTGGSSGATGGSTGGGASSGGGAGSGSAGGSTGGSAGGSSGGSADSGSTDVGGNTEIPSEKFTDLGNHAWAKDAIYTLVEKGVINGTSDSTYSPAKNIKRADFAIMLVRAFGITEGEGENFADVDADKYYANELRLAKAAGIVNGIGDNKFNPEGEITRQDMMLMLYRALKAMGYELNSAAEDTLAEFADADNISSYANEAVESLIANELVKGSNSLINPRANTTRAEVAVLIERMISAFMSTNA